MNTQIAFYIWDNYGAGREREHPLTCKYPTLFSFAKINHNWAGTHNHRGNLMTHFIFGSSTPNSLLSLSPPSPRFFLHDLHSPPDFLEKRKKERLSKLLHVDGTDYIGESFARIQLSPGHIQWSIQCLCVWKVRRLTSKTLSPISLGIWGCVRTDTVIQCCTTTLIQWNIDFYYLPFKRLRFYSRELVRWDWGIFKVKAAAAVLS